MSKNLKRVAALVLVLSICASMFAIISAQAYTAEITGWSTGLDASYTWFDGVAEDEKQGVRDVLADELAYQNDVLDFNMGTSDDGKTSWGMSSWGGMVAVQVENNKAGDDVTDNTGNPWGQAGRRWAIVIAPFLNTAFSVKGDFAKNYPSSGLNPALGNQFKVGDVEYQLYWNGYVSKTGETFATVSKGAGAKNASVSDMTKNKFRYAVAMYNQNNKREKTDGTALTVGYPDTWTKTTTDKNVIYQSFINPEGNAYVAVKADTVDDGNLAGAYVIGATLTKTFDTLGADVNARFAITGAPVSDEENGVQHFENGTLTKSGFKSGAKEITSFSINGELSPAVINEETSTVFAYVKSGTALTAINPTIAHSGALITPSGAQDFSKPLEYTVTAADGTTKTYTVTVFSLSSTDITSFVIDGVQADIDYSSKTITAVVDGDYDLSAATATITALDSAATLAPASGATMNLSDSWTNGVSLKATKGSESSTYTIHVRNKSKDTSITSFVIPDGQLKYQGKNGDVVGTISGSSILLTYEYGNELGQKTIANVTVAEGATVSPDPTEKHMQSGQKYVVTAEAGNTTTYTARASMDTTDKTFAPVTADDLNLSVNFMTGKFSRSDYAKAKTAILNEYNYQRSLGIDPGTPVGNIEGWDELLNRQFFKDGYGCGTSMDLGASANGSCIIMVDVPSGNAYTLKNKMLSMWQYNIADEDGNSSYLFAKAGAPAVNEFSMNGLTYQQMAHSYAFYDSSNNGSVIRHGIADFGSKQIAALGSSLYYSGIKKTLTSDITSNMRFAYEYANKIGYNPGVADGGVTSLVTFENGGGLQYKVVGESKDTYREHSTSNSKGEVTTTIDSGKFDTYMLYQIFSGSGETKSTSRNVADKTIIIKGADQYGFDNGGAIALFNYGKYKVKDMYENLPGCEYVDQSIGGISFKYNTTLGTPKKYVIDKDGNLIMTFVKTVSVSTETDEEGITELVHETENGYYVYNTTTGAISNWIEGDYLSSDNTLSQAAGDVKVDDVNAEIKIVNKGDAYDYDKEQGYAEDECRIYDENAIYINYSKDFTVDISNIQFTVLTPNEAFAAVTTPALLEGDIYATLDCDIGGGLYVQAENESNRLYTVYVYQDGKLVSSVLGGKDWGFWSTAYVPPVSYPYYNAEENMWYITDESQINQGLKDENGEPLWNQVYGFYKNNDNSDNSNWVTIAKVGEWTKPATEPEWRVYYILNFYGKV